MTRDEALALVHEYTPSEALRRHMYAVEIAMRAMAEHGGHDPEAWGLAGLLHDFDYERFPNAAHAATEEHPAEGVRILARLGVAEEIRRAILGHASYTGVPRDTPMARALFGVDELCGFLVACALVRPSRSLADLEVASVRKKLKDKAFARGVNRDDVHQGAAELGIRLDELIGMLLAALRPHERVLGLGERVTEAHAPRGMTDRSKTGRMFDRVAHTRPIPGNAVTLYHEAPVALDAMLDLIATAERWIHFDNYIIRDDRTGLRFAEALMARAREGLPVRLLTDWVGSIGTGRRFWARLRQAGVEVRVFNPPRIASLFGILSRDHRKMVVADGARALTGGICIGDEWAGDPVRGLLPWRDSAVRVDGPAAAVLDQAFAKVWSRCGAPLPEPEHVAEVAPAGEAEVRVLAGEPGRSRMERLVVMVLAGVADRIWLTDAYMVAPKSVAEAMADAARDGADVRLLVPGSSDLPYIRNLTRIGYRPLLAAGVRIFEWGGPMLHAKSTVTDGRWVRIGSTNLNWSSLVGNWELDVVIEHPALAAEMEATFRRDLEHSAEVQIRPLRAFPRLQRVLPHALAIEPPDQPLPKHPRDRRERRQRRLVALLAVVTSAQRALFGTAALVMLALGILAWLLPRVVGLTFGVLSLLVAILAFRGMLRRHREAPQLD